VRKVSLVLGMAVACVSGFWVAGGGVAQASEPGAAVVYLDGPAALAKLRAANPIHYQRATKIIESANTLCRPDAGEVEYAKFDARNITCARMLLKTSNPPKRELSFRLDETQYVALVTVTDDPPKFVAATSSQK
jgi:hypothetical protein